MDKPKPFIVFTILVATIAEGKAGGIQLVAVFNLTAGYR